MAPFFNEIVIKSLRNAATTPVGDAQHSLTGCTWSGHSHSVPVARNPTFQFKPNFTSKSHITINKNIYPSRFLSFSWWKCITSRRIIITALGPPGNLQGWPWTRLQPCRARSHCTGASAVHHGTHWSSCALKWSCKHQIMQCSKWPDSGLRQVQSFKTWDNFIFC